MDIRNTHRQISFSLFFTVGRRQLYDSKKEFSLLPQRQAAFFMRLMRGFLYTIKGSHDKMDGCLQIKNHCFIF